ncbi:RNA-directed DNA polymerase, eukaryota [Tanacetum coccineum]
MFKEKSSHQGTHDTWKEISADLFGLNILLGLKKACRFNSVGNGKIKGDGFGMLDEIDSCAGLWGLGSKSKKEWVKELSNNNKLNFIAIQETKMEKVSHMDVKFMWGKSIMDYVVLVNGWKKKKALFFKVDFAKAYDSVRWDFLLDVLEAFGFGSTWCTWIRAVHGIRLISFSRKVSIWSSILKEVQCLSQSGFDFLSYCSRTYRYGQSTSLGKDLG